MADFDFLKNVHVFGGLNDEQLMALCDGCVEKAFHEGDKLFDEGEEANHLWIVVDGTVEVRFELPGHEAPQANTVSSHIFRSDYWLVQFCSPLSIQPAGVLHLQELQGHKDKKGFSAGAV